MFHLILVVWLTRKHISVIDNDVTGSDYVFPHDVLYLVEVLKCDTLLLIA